MNISVSFATTLRTKHGIPKKVITQKVEKAITLFFRKKERRVNVTIVFCGNTHIRTLNRNFRTIDGVTDVLSFVDGELCQDGEYYLGEIYIAYPVAARQASRYGHSVTNELVVLSVHGILHLLGFDHEKQHDYTVMQRAEKRILGNTGLIDRLVW